MLCFACGNYSIVLTCHIYPRIHTHTHTHTHTHNLNFAIFWKDCEIKYMSNRKNAGPQNLMHRNSCFLMKTSDIRRRLGKVMEIN